MKKLLSILSAVVLTSSASTSIIACGSQEKLTIDLKTIVKNQNLGKIVISKKVVPDKKDILKAIKAINSAALTLTENDFEFKLGDITTSSSPLIIGTGKIIGMGKYQGEVKIEYSSINFSLVKKIPNAMIESLKTDKAGNVYIGTNLGVWEINKKNNQLTQILNVDAQIKNLLIDKDDNLYAGVWWGRSVESKSSFNIYKKKKDDPYLTASTSISEPLAPSVSVGDLAIDSTGTIYAATNIGIYKTNDDKSAFIKFAKDISSDYTLVLAVDKDDNLYAGGLMGLFMKKKNQEQFTRRLYYDTFCLATDKDGNVYAGCVTGVFKMNGTNSFISLILGTSGKIESLAVDKDGNVYAGSGNGSVYKSNGTSLFIFIFDLNNDVQALVLDQDDNLYAGNTSYEGYASNVSGNLFKS